MTSITNSIKKYVIDRGIDYLIHFTRESNLDSILQRGLLPRDVLIKEGFGNFNDQRRLDGTHAVCLSIGFPNYKMFFGLRQEIKEVDWVILAINPSALWMLPCAFCVANAASSGVTALPLEQRRDLSALRTMYEDCSGKARAVLGIPSHYPTNPQAEVLMLNGVPKEYISRVIVLTTAKQQELRVKYPGLDVQVEARYFRYRRDCTHWK